MTEQLNPPASPLWNVVIALDVTGGTPIGIRPALEGAATSNVRKFSGPAHVCPRSRGALRLAPDENPLSNRADKNLVSIRECPDDVAAIRARVATDLGQYCDLVLLHLGARHYHRPRPGALEFGKAKRMIRTITRRQNIGRNWFVALRSSRNLRLRRSYRREATEQHRREQAFRHKSLHEAVRWD